MFSVFQQQRQKLRINFLVTFCKISNTSRATYHVHCIKLYQIYRIEFLKTVTSVQKL